MRIVNRAFLPVLAGGMAALALALATGCSSSTNPQQDVIQEVTDPGGQQDVVPDTADPGTPRDVQDPGPGTDVQDPGPAADVQDHGQDGLDIQDDGMGDEDIPCQTMCGDTRVCGDDGCGGSCGECTGTDVCDTISGICVGVCNWETDKPTTWGPSGVISALQTPADTTTVQNTCFDYTGDSLGDNGLKGLAGQVNGPLADAINGGDIGIVFEMAGVTDFSNTADFQLNGLLAQSTATPPVLSGDFYVQEESYVQQTCKPMIYFAGARIVDGELMAGPSMFKLSIPIQADLMIEATLIQAQVKGTITAGSADGVTLTGGVLSGVLTKANLDAAIDGLQASCDAAPASDKPSYCSYLTVVRSAEALLFDLHQNGDGTFTAKTKDLPGDAASVCLSFELSNAKVVGFVPPAP